jgi:hypothetical protein
MPRQFFPALRGLLVPGTAAPPPPATETKDLLAGNSYVSMTYAGVTNVWGTPGRADGWDRERVIVEGYERSIWTFKSVEAISKHASTRPSRSAGAAMSGASRRRSLTTRFCGCSTGRPTCSRPATSSRSG